MPKTPSESIRLTIKRAQALVRGKVNLIATLIMMIFLLAPCGKARSIEHTQELEADMVLVPGGVFSMALTKHAEGSYAPESGYNLNFESVEVDPFYLGKYEVSLLEFLAFLEATGYESHAALGRGGVFHPDPDFEYSPEGIFSDAFYLNSNETDKNTLAGYPAGAVTWDDAIMYCNWKSAQAGLEQVYTIRDTGKPVEWEDYLTYWEVSADWSANGYRLPTEAEWTFAAMGGAQSKGYTYSGSHNIDEVAFYTENSGWGTRKSGLKMPNELGLYDMSGNLWEWCWDSIVPGYDLEPGVKNPQGPAQGSMKVIKGGAWECESQLCRLDNRYRSEKHFAHVYQGFRLCRSAQGKK